MTGSRVRVLRGGQEVKIQIPDPGRSGRHSSYLVTKLVTARPQTQRRQRRPGDMPEQKPRLPVPGEHQTHGVAPQLVQAPCLLSPDCWRWSLALAGLCRTAMLAAIPLCRNRRGTAARRGPPLEPAAENGSPATTGHTKRITPSAPAPPGATASQAMAAALRPILHVRASQLRGAVPSWVRPSCALRSSWFPLSARN